jgi:UDP-GlcNAc:undecaprenyl-phosphate GlcNAc-1-phosphate transferase
LLKHLGFRIKYGQGINYLVHILLGRKSVDDVFLKLFFASGISFLVTFYLTPILCQVATRLNLVDRPDGKIKIHKNPTPYLGGVAIYLGFLCAFVLTFPGENRISMLFAGATLLLFIGLFDDITVMNPLQKLAGQAIVAFCFIKAGLYLKAHFFYNFWSIPLSLLWILTITNAFNLVDVMDGLASVITIGVSISFLVLALHFKLFAVALILCALLGAIIAFLWYNRPDAKIYMGDAGSLFLGGLLSVIPFFFDWGRYNWYGYLAPIVIFAIPLLEIGALIIIRAYKGIPFYMGSPDHFSIYLQRKNWGKTSILWYIFALSLFLTLVSFLFVLDKIPLLGLAILAVLFVIFWIFMLLPPSK